MLPLAVILKGLGHRVSGSDRSFDQGRTPEKFGWIQAQGITLFPQDGSGVSRDIDAIVVSKAVEDTVPDIAAAKAAGIPILQRAELLTAIFNAAGLRIAVSGTSGKTTTTGMIAFLLKESGRDPTVMNGGIFLNYRADNPYATAFVGRGDVFVTEVDESDGIDIVRRYTPDIAVVHNVTLDHQPMEELRAMFSAFLHETRDAALNADDPLVMELAQTFTGRRMTYGMQADADLTARDIRHHPDGVSATLRFRGGAAALRLNLPGAHNVSNALAAITACIMAGMALDECADILSRFKGIKRRMEVVGSAKGITVMDDFAHNPDKIAATLSALKQFPGRAVIFFQPHGYGFLKVVGAEVAEAFAQGLKKDDLLYMVEPLYMGGTVDRSVTGADIAAQIQNLGGNARIMPGRDAVRDAIIAAARKGDRIIVMGARDDTLSDFAQGILESL